MALRSLSPPRTALSAAARLGALGLCLSTAGAAPVRAATAGADAMQVMADIVLIEARCRALNVDYGKAFAFLQRNGIDPVDIMPLGARRSAFDIAYRRRATGTDDRALCADLAAERQRDIPGVFTAR